MGTKKTWACGSCRYRVETTGGMDVGFAGYFNTFVCEKCRKLVDLIVDPRNGDESNFHSDEYTDDLERILPVSTLLRPGQHCYSCRVKKYLVIWDQHTCPKCAGEMSIDPNGMTVLWD